MVTAAVMMPSRCCGVVAKLATAAAMMPRMITWTDGRILDGGANGRMDKWAAARTGGFFKVFKYGFLFLFLKYGGTFFQIFL